jgi:hypothetical protein
MPAMRSDLGRGGDVEWLAKYLARVRRQRRETGNVGT